ncbi:hypothetical protein LZ30DRAFT_740778 [Colletotrichum cereale]|nr:hypothetical protein LZ30DRAFT_740778 [Colletotrichum cereale]
MHIIIIQKTRMGAPVLSARQKSGDDAGEEQPRARPPTRGGGPGGGGGVIGRRDHDGPVPAAVDRGLLRHAGVVGRLVVAHLGEVGLRARGDAGGGREERGVVAGAAGVCRGLDGGGGGCGCDCDGGDGDGGGSGGRREGGVGRDGVLRGGYAVEPGRV